MSCHETCDPCDAGDPECCYKDQGVADLRAQVAALTKRAEEAERERDLAIAHDRQPYPTAWAYEQLAAANERRRVEIDALTKRCEALAGALAQVRDRAARVLSSENTDGDDLLAALERIGEVARAALESNDGRKP